MDLGNVYGFNVIVIILNTILALVIALAAGKMHEVIHAIRAKQLGYKVTSFPLYKNEVDIHTKDCDGNCNDTCFTQDDPNFKSVARISYYILMPFGFLLVLFGYYMWTVRNTYFLGVMIGGIAIVFLHLMTLKFEGKDLNEKSLDKKEK